MVLSATHGPKRRSEPPPSWAIRYVPPSRNHVRLSSPSCTCPRYVAYISLILSNLPALCLTTLSILFPQGYGPFSAPAPPVITRAKRKQVKMAVCPVFHFLLCHIDWHLSVTSARIALLPVSGATRHVPAKDVKSMVSRTRVWTVCVKPERLGSNVVPTNVKVNLLLLSHLRTRVSSPLPELYASSHISL